MKNKLLSMISLLLTLCILLVGCNDGKNDPPAGETTAATEAPTNAPDVPDVPDNTPVTVTETYLPKDVSARLKVLFESGAATFSAFSPSVGPFAIRDLYTISNCRIKSITIPVYKTLSADRNGNFLITLSEVGNSYEDLKKPARKTHLVYINGEDYNLEANTMVMRFITIDLTDYDIVLDADETLAYVSPNDTLIPGYLGNADASNEATVIMRRDVGVTGFLSRVGRTDDNLATHTTTLVFDFEMERTYENRAAYEAVLQAEADYEARVAALREVYAGKKLSIIGDSISTFQGVSNSALINSTIGKNAVWNTTDRNFHDYTDIYWGQVLEQLEMELCVCNAWSGSKVYGGGNGQTTGIDNMLGRASELDRDDGTMPDVIFAYMGINDLRDGSPESELYTLLTNGDTTKSNNEKVGEWFAKVLENSKKTSTIKFGETYKAWDESYALSIYTMLENYGDAEIYCFTLLKNYNELCTDAKYERYNTCIRAIAEYFEVGLIDQQKGLMNDETFYTYGNDATALHPSALGHAMIGRHVINTLYENLEK